MNILKKGLINLIGGKAKELFGFNVLFGNFGGFNGSSRYTTEKLIDYGYVSNVDIYAIIRKITDSALKLPWAVVDEKKGETIESTDGPFYDLIKRPQKDISRNEWLENTLGYFLLTGNMLWKKNTAVGFEEIQELEIIPTPFVDVIQSLNKYGECRGYTWDFGPSKSMTLTPEEVIHLKYFNPSRWGVTSCWGLSPLQASFLMLTASNNRFVASASMLENRGATGLISNKTQEGYTEEQKKDIQKVVDRKFGGAEKFGKIIATSAMVDYKAIGLTSVELQLLEAAQLNLRQACNVYGVDSSLFNDPANRTQNNKGSSMKGLFTEAVMPLTSRVIDQINFDVAPLMNEITGRNEKVIFRPDLVEVLQEDQNEQAKKDARISDGISKILISISKDEITKEQAVQLLIQCWHLSEDEAKKIVAL